MGINCQVIPSQIHNFHVIYFDNSYHKRHKIRAVTGLIVRSRFFKVNHRMYNTFKNLISENGHNGYGSVVFIR